MVKKKKTADKSAGGMPGWLQAIIVGGLLIVIGLLSSIQINTNQLSDIKTTLTKVEEHTNQLTDIQNILTRVEERTKHIEGVKSGVDRLLGKFGIAEITPTDGGILVTSNVKIEVPPNSVPEPTWFSLETTSSSNLPAALPNKDYIYTSSIAWSGGRELSNYADVTWNLAVGSDCEQTKIFYWNHNSNMWQEVVTEYCSPTLDLLRFHTKASGYYVLTNKAE